MCIMSSFLQPFLMPSSLQNGLRIFINRYSLLTCISWREILPYYSQNAWSVLPKQWLMRSLIQSCPLDINQLLYEWQRGSPDEWQRSSLPEFLSSHLNTSFPGTLLVFNQSQLSFLPICELNEHHGGQMSSKWGRHFRTSPLHDQLSCMYMYCSLVQSTLDIWMDATVGWLQYSVDFLKFKAPLDKWMH